VFFIADLVPLRPSNSGQSCDSHHVHPFLWSGARPAQPHSITIHPLHITYCLVNTTQQNFGPSHYSTMMRTRRLPKEENHIFSRQGSRSKYSSSTGLFRSTAPLLLLCQWHTIMDERHCCSSFEFQINWYLSYCKNGGNGSSTASTCVSLLRLITEMDDGSRATCHTSVSSPVSRWRGILAWEWGWEKFSMKLVLMRDSSAIVQMCQFHVCTGLLCRRVKLYEITYSC